VCEVIGHSVKPPAAVDTRGLQCQRATTAVLARYDPVIRIDTSLSSRLYVSVPIACSSDVRLYSCHCRDTDIGHGLGPYMGWIGSVGGVAQWLERRSLTGGLSLIYA